MKIGISSFCWTCFRETNQTKEDYERLRKELNSDIDAEVEINEDNIYEVVCPRGHKTVTRLQQQNFEILFDLAAMALLDGYTKEAVSGLSSSIEKFLEFYILVISIENDVDMNKYLEYRKITNLSERQLGAYFTLRLLNKKNIYWDKKMVSLRNDVIHKGYIPKTEQAIEYGEYALKLIMQSLKELQSENSKALRRATFINLKSNSDKIEQNVAISTAGMPTILNLGSLDISHFADRNVTFREALRSISKNSLYKHFYKKNIDL